MRNTPIARGWSATIVILVVNILVFFAEHSNGTQSRRAFSEFGALSIGGLERGFLWQFFTFQFMHDGLIHLVLNSLALYFFGRPIEDALGKNSFLKLYFLSGVAGGVVHVLLAVLFPRFGGPMVGASAGICGLVAAFSLLYPASTILIGFVLPLRAQYFLPIMVGLSVVLLFLGGDTKVAHGAHLGGLMFGVAYFRWFRGSSWFADFFQRLRRGRQSRPIVKVRFPKASSWQEEPNGRGEGAGPTDFISKEVDPILEKISAHGIHSLTERERKILEAARARMDKK